MVAICQLTVQHVRNLKQVELSPTQGINLITGPNGAGKTSLLEAIHILARGRSFRSRRNNEWITRGETAAQIVARTHQVSIDSDLDAIKKTVTLGLEKSRNDWKARINGEKATRFGDLSRQLPLVVFEPNAHELVNGGPEGRRTFLDWGVFHVEHNYTQVWQRYHRALRQRNAALREHASASIISSLTPTLCAAANQLHQMRVMFVNQLQERFIELYGNLQPQMPEAKLSYQRGWSEKEDLSELLRNEQTRDQDIGYTRYGPHRADIALQHEQRALRGWLSRGQQKLLALLLLLAQQAVWQRYIKQTPIILLDDLYSELDKHHCSKVINLLQDMQSQVWITSTTAKLDRYACATMFHVEHGQVVQGK